MKREVFKVFLLVAILLVNITCSPSLNNLQDLEKKYIESENFDESTKLFEKISIEAKNLISLTFDDKEFLATAVFICTELTEDIVCRGVYADDTNHVAEMLAPRILLTPNKKIKVNIKVADLATNIQFYTSIAKEVTKETAKKVTLTVDGILDIPIINEDEDQVLFAIVKGKGDLLYKKYVWVIEPKP